MIKPTWSSPRHRDYERELRKVAASWFAEKDLAAQRKYAYILATHDLWPKKIILPEVIQHPIAICIQICYFKYT